MDHVISVLFFYACARLSIDVLWSPAGKGLTSWLSFLMSNCEVVTFPSVSWVRCGSWMYRFLIFALFLTLQINITILVSDLNILAQLGVFSYRKRNHSYIYDEKLGQSYTFS